MSASTIFGLGLDLDCRHKIIWMLPSIQTQTLLSTIFTSVNNCKQVTCVVWSSAWTFSNPASSNICWQKRETMSIFKLHLILSFFKHSHSSNKTHESSSTFAWVLIEDSFAVQTFMANAQIPLLNFRQLLIWQSSNFYVNYVVACPSADWVPYLSIVLHTVEVIATLVNIGSKLRRWCWWRSAVVADKQSASRLQPLIEFLEKTGFVLWFKSPHC